MHSETSACTVTDLAGIAALTRNTDTILISDGITAIGSIRYAFPTHYFDSWDNLFTPGGANSDMVRGALLPIAYVLVFCGIGYWWFRRKDVLS